jgi:alanine-synthesizing transaminase
MFEPSPEPVFRPSRRLDGVHYELRGPLARRALELEQQGHTIIKLNIGNPAQFGFRAAETVRLAMRENLALAEGYCHQKGIVSAREAVAADAVARGVRGVVADDVFIGNGASELILMSMEGLLEPGDEALVPAPDYPLWTASVSLTGARPVHYPCRPESGFVPDPDEVERLITPKTRALVVINPNNPTGAVYPRDTLEALARVAERHRIVLLADEIYDRILYDGATHVPLARLCEGTLVGTFGGLSKVHRACGVRTGWLVWSGKKQHARGYLDGLELLSSLRLCANVPGQYAVAAALAGAQSIYELTSDEGRLGRQRRAILRGVERSAFLHVVPPRGALYAFPGVDLVKIPRFDDRRFAMELLDTEHVFITPGSGFNVPYTNHVRFTFLPDEDTITEVFTRVERVLERWAAMK